MNKKYRDGLDIAVAFSSGCRRMIENPVTTTSTCDSSSAAGPQAVSQDTIQVTLPQDGLLKRILKRPARLIYRLMKPIVRPFAFRLRRYFIEEFRQQILQEIRHASALALQKNQESGAALKHEVLNTHAQLLRAVQELSDSTLQEIQKAQESSTALKNEVLGVYAQLREDVQGSSVSALQKGNDSSEKLKQEILNVQKRVQLEVQHLSSTMLTETQEQFSNLKSGLRRVEQYTAASSRRVAINCGGDEILVKTQVGYLLCSAADHAVVACLVDTGDLELGTRLIIQRFLHPGDVFVDVGANLGLHTLAAARAMSGQGKIIAFEPFESTKRLLEKSVWMNGFYEITEIHQTAVSNLSGSEKLYLGATSGHHSLFPLAPPAQSASEAVDVPIVRLDEIIEEGLKVDLIKIDAEGAELEILEGGSSIIESNPDIALIVEFGPSHLKRTGHSTLQWLDAFQDLGLSYKAIHAETGGLESWSPEQLEEVESINLFFAREGSAAWDRTLT